MGAIAALVVLGAGVGAWLGLRGDDAPDQPQQGASASDTPRSSRPMERRRIFLTRHARAFPGTRCFGPRGDAFVRIGGRRRATGILQCGDSSGEKATGGFTVGFAPFVGSRSATLASFTATVGVDEASRGDTVGPASFDVTYGGEPVCSVTAYKGSPARCTGSALGIQIRRGAKLRMEITAPSANTALSLWATYVDAQVVLEVE